MKANSTWKKWIAIFLDVCVIYFLLGMGYFTFSNSTVNVLTGNWSGVSNWKSLLAAGGVGLLGDFLGIFSMLSGTSYNLSNLSASLNNGSLTLPETYMVVLDSNDLAHSLNDNDLISLTGSICLILLSLIALFVLFEVINILAGFFGKGINLFCVYYGTLFFFLLAGTVLLIDLAVVNNDTASEILGTLPMGVSIWAVCCLVFPYISRGLMKSYANEKKMADMNQPETQPETQPEAQAEKKFRKDQYFVHIVGRNWDRIQRRSGQK